MMQFGIPIGSILVSHSKIIQTIQKRTKGTIIGTANGCSAAAAAGGSNVCPQTTASERRAKATMQRNNKTTKGQMAKHLLIFGVGCRTRSKKVVAKWRTRWLA